MYPIIVYGTLMNLVEEHRISLEITGNYGPPTLKPDPMTGEYPLLTYQVEYGKPLTVKISKDMFSDPDGDDYSISARSFPDFATVDGSIIKVNPWSKD